MHTRWTRFKQQLQVANAQEDMHESQMSGVLAASQECHQELQHIDRRVRVPWLPEACLMKMRRYTNSRQRKLPSPFIATYLKVKNNDRNSFLRDAQEHKVEEMDHQDYSLQQSPMMCNMKVTWHRSTHAGSKAL